MTHHFDVVLLPFWNNVATTLLPHPPTNPCYVVDIFLRDVKYELHVQGFIYLFIFGKVWGPHAVVLLSETPCTKKIGLCAQDKGTIHNTIVM